MYSGFMRKIKNPTTDREGTQSVSGHSTLGRVDPELPPEIEPPTDGVGQVFQGLRQVPPHIPLHQDRDGEDPHVHQVRPVHHPQQGLLEGNPEALLLEDPAELEGHLRGALIPHHPDGRRRGGARPGWPE